MKYLFLLGCHRSGTSMLQQALNRHSGIVIPPETKYFSSFLGHSRKCQLKRLARINTDLQIDIPLPPETIRGIVKSRQFYGEMTERYLAKLKMKNTTYFERRPQRMQVTYRGLNGCFLTPSFCGYTGMVGT